MREEYDFSKAERGKFYNADADIEEYRLYVLDKTRKGQEAIEHGKILTSEELQREIGSW